MAKRIKKTENYELGNGHLILTTYSGDANHSDITVKLNKAQVVNGETVITDFNIGKSDGLQNSELYIYAKISKTNPGNHVSFTIELKDDVNSTKYLYNSVEESETIIKYSITIKLSKNE